MANKLYMWLTLLCGSTLSPYVPLFASYSHFCTFSAVRQQVHFLHISDTNEEKLCRAQVYTHFLWAVRMSNNAQR